MAFPTVAARTESALTTAATTFTVNFTQTTGDLVVIFVAQAPSPAPSGISLSDSFIDLTAGGSTFHIIYKILDGSEGGNVVVTWAGAISAKGAALAYNIQDYDPGIAPEFSTVATGTSTTPDPGSLSPTGGSKDYLWIAAFGQNGEEADDDTWCTAAPTSFSNLIQKTSGTGGAATSNAQTAAASFIQTNSTQNPSTFTVAQSLAWRAYTVAVHPAIPRVPKFSSYPQLIPH